LPFLDLLSLIRSTETAIHLALTVHCFISCGPATFFGHLYTVREIVRESSCVLRYIVRPIIILVNSRM